MKTAVRERPILLSGRWVRAICYGQKTQTRRPIGRRTSEGKWVVPPPPPIEDVHKLSGSDYHLFDDGMKAGTWRVAGPVWAVRDLTGGMAEWECPFGTAGDGLWVRESFVNGYQEDENGRLIAYDEIGAQLPEKIWYRADDEWFTWLDDDGNHTEDIPWKPSIHMRRDQSRIDLAITQIRAERVRAISHEDAIAEGCPGADEFLAAWESIYGQRGFPLASDPWAWAVTFEVKQIRSGTAATEGANR